jgi:hypothetical protein
MGRAISAVRLSALVTFIGYSCIRAKPLLTTDAALWLGRSSG